MPPKKNGSRVARSQPGRNRWTRIALIAAGLGTLSTGALSADPSGLAKPPFKRILVCFRNDDIGSMADADQERMVMEVFERYGFRQTFGVIPCQTVEPEEDRDGRLQLPLSENRAIVTLLRQWLAEGKISVALHGFTHRSNRQFGGEGWHAEFRGLPYAEQLRRMRAGLRICRDTLGVTPTVFIPPWNEWDANTIRACVAAGMSAISSELYTPTPEGMLSININTIPETFPEDLARAEQADKPVLLVMLYHSRDIGVKMDVSVLERAIAAAAASDHVTVATLEEIMDWAPELVRSVDLAGRNMGPQQLDGNPARAGAVLYRRILAKIGMPPSVERLYEEARSDYVAGRYSASSALSPAIDSDCAALVAKGRAGMVLVGLVVGTLVFLACKPVRRSSRIRKVLYGGVPGAILLLGGLAASKASVPATKKELDVATVTLVVGCVVGTLISHLALGRRRGPRDQGVRGKQGEQDVRETG